MTCHIPFVMWIWSSPWVETVPSCTPAISSMILFQFLESILTQLKLMRVKEKDGETRAKTVNCRSSGLRVCTAAGSTAAMQSAGGFVMPMLSRDLQFMVREPISPGSTAIQMHSAFKPDQSMDVNWYSDHGTVYIDGCHVHYNVQLGDTIEISSNAPVLNVFLSHCFTQIRSRY